MMSCNREIAAAFACGVLVTVGLLSTTGGPAGTELYAPAVVQVTPLATTGVMPATPTIRAEERLTAQTTPYVGDDLPYIPSTLSTASSLPSLWTLGATLVAGGGALLGLAVRRAIHRAASPELETLVVLPETESVAMAALLGKMRMLSKDRQEMLSSDWVDKRKFMAAPLSKELREKYNVRSMVVRKGDDVRVLAGDFKGLTGKVTESDIKHLVIFVEGLERKKNNGKTVRIPIDPSKVEITNMVLEDKSRVEILERRAKGRAELAARRAKIHAGELEV